jgi:hypothetical protein
MQGGEEEDYLEVDSLESSSSDEDGNQTSQFNKQVTKFDLNKLANKFFVRRNSFIFKHEGEIKKFYSFERVIIQLNVLRK